MGENIVPSFYKQRIDTLLVDRGFFLSRQKAREAVERGEVLFAGEKVIKPAQLVHKEGEITLTTKEVQWVSRGAYKLLGALDGWSIDVYGRRALDIGASTGGFTQVLLHRGVKEVISLDVGKGQLASVLREDSRVRVYEEQDIRTFSLAQLGVPVDMIVADLSFISLEKVFPYFTSLIQGGGILLLLLKPQFEVGPDFVGKGGVVKNEEKVKACLSYYRDYFFDMNYDVKGVMPSVLKGGEGNQEYFFYLTKTA